jgi:hypothetical protein
MDFPSFVGKTKKNFAEKIKCQLGVNALAAVELTRILFISVGVMTAVHIFAKNVVLIG